MRYKLFFIWLGILLFLTGVGLTIYVVKQEEKDALQLGLIAIFFSSGISLSMNGISLYGEGKSKSEFMKKAFLHEAKYNLQLIKTIREKGNSQAVQLLFDTRCYSIFKADIALLYRSADDINELYLELYKRNAEIEDAFRGERYAPLDYTQIGPYYYAVEESIKQFRDKLEKPTNLRK